MYLHWITDITIKIDVKGACVERNYTNIRVGDHLLVQSDGFSPQYLSEPFEYPYHVIVNNIPYTSCNGLNITISPWQTKHYCSYEYMYMYKNYNWSEFHKMYLNKVTLDRIPLYLDESDLHNEYNIVSIL